MVFADLTRNDDYFTSFKNTDVFNIVFEFLNKCLRLNHRSKHGVIQANARGLTFCCWWWCYQWGRVSFVIWFEHKQKSFYLDRLSDDECKTYFRFYKSNINLLIENLQIPERITCYNGSIFNGLEAYCVLFERFALEDLFLSYRWLAITC